MVKRTSLKFCLELIFILVILMVEFKALEERKMLPVYDPDEVSWIFAGYYFNLYFLHFDLFHQDWNDYEAFDHPPLVKYIVGAALFLRGYTINSLDPKRVLNRPPDQFSGVRLASVIPKIPNPTVVIPFARSVIFAFALSSLLLVYIFARIRYGVLPAFISTLLIISSPIFNYVSTRILADPILLAFFALFIVLCALYLNSTKHIYVVVAFVVSSLAFLTKLNGIVLIPVLMIVFLIKNRWTISRNDLKFMFSGSIAFLFIAIILNPVFLNTGIEAIRKMIEVRLAAFRGYQEFYRSVALLSVSDRFVTSAKMIFFEYSLFYQLIKVPVELIMFALGLLDICRRRDLFLMAVFAFLVVIPISMLPFNTPRYYYWILPFIYIIAAVSLNLFKDMCLRRGILLLKFKTNCYTVVRRLGKKCISG